ncbi:MAG: class I SAM-dependent methyltransferase [Leucothrix sp.]
MTPPAQCSLCEHKHLKLYFSDIRHYWQCERCALVAVNAHEHLSEVDEKARYDLHENDPNDAGYRRFLNRLVEPLSQRLSKGSQGLDFGCGPGPTVSLLLAEQGHQTACYDKYYANHPALLSRSYDFITTTEVLEHLREPGRELTRLIELLKPGGYLGIMTKRLPTLAQFPRWHYKQDPTHICFYADSTFEWIAEHWALSLEIIDNDVVILQAGN